MKRGPVWARLARALGSVYLLIPVIAAAAGALIYYAYRYADQLASAGEQNLVAANSGIADIQVSRVEQAILDAEEGLFNAIDPSNLRDPNRLTAILRGSKLVESLIILDEHQKVAPGGQYTRKPAREYEAFRRRLEEELVPALGLSNLARGEVRHLHRELDGRYYLIAATRREVEGKSYYVVVETDLALLVVDVLPAYFEGVEVRHVFQVVDEHDEIVFGYPFTGVSPRYTVEVPFPQALQAWKLRMAPREVPAVLGRESERRSFDVAVIGFAAIAMLVGVGVLVWAVRAERQANRLKSDFIANVSHELKTPLSLIRMFGEMLATGRTKGEESSKEYAQIITRESERLSRLIDNVLDFARIERGKAAYAFALGDLGEVLARALDVYRYRLEREDMKLDLRVAEDLPPVELDESAMTLVVMNLVDNAIKYAAKGKELKVAVTSEKDADLPGGARVWLEVADRGPGIPPDEAERVFDRFYRGRDARGTRVRGSGIGLALVRHIARAHGGDVELHSAPGEGCRFRVWLPAAAEGAGAAERAEAVTS